MQGILRVRRLGIWWTSCEKVGDISLSEVGHEPVNSSVSLSARACSQAGKKGSGYDSDRRGSWHQIRTASQRCTHTCRHIYISIYACMLSMYTHASKCICTLAFTNIHRYTHVCTDVYTYIYIYRYTHIHNHTYMYSFLLSLFSPSLPLFKVEFPLVITSF